MRNVLLTGGALFAALIGSYFVWTGADDAPADASKVAVYASDDDDVTQIVYKADDLTVTLDRRKDASGAYTWVTTQEPLQKPPPPGDTDAPPPADPVEMRELGFLGGEAAEKLHDQFSPLYALRELTSGGPGYDPTVFGFDGSTTRLTVTVKGQPIEMIIGGETYGQRDRYAKIGEKVYLLDDGDLRPLQYAKTRLTERATQPLGLSEMDSVTLDASGQKITFLQVNRQDPENAFWAREASPTTKDDIAATWLDKLFKVRSQVFVAEKDVPTVLTPVFTYAVRGKKDGESQAWTVEVTRDDAATPPEYYAKSSYTRGVVKLTRTPAGDVTADLQAILSGEAPPTEPPPTAPPGPPKPQ